MELEKELKHRHQRKTSINTPDSCLPVMQLHIHPIHVSCHCFSLPPRPLQQAHVCLDHISGLVSFFHCMSQPINRVNPQTALDICEDILYCYLYTQGGGASTVPTIQGCRSEVYGRKGDGANTAPTTRVVHSRWFRCYHDIDRPSVYLSTCHVFHEGGEASIVLTIQDRSAPPPHLVWGWDEGKKLDYMIVSYPGYFEMRETVQLNGSDYLDSTLENACKCQHSSTDAWTLASQLKDETFMPENPLAQHNRDSNSSLTDVLSNLIIDSITHCTMLARLVFTELMILCNVYSYQRTGYPSLLCTLDGTSTRQHTTYKFYTRKGMIICSLRNSTYSNGNHMWMRLVMLRGGDIEINP